MKQRNAICLLLLSLACLGFADEQDKKVESLIDALRAADREVRQNKFSLHEMDSKGNPKWENGRRALIDLIMMGEKGWAAITALSLNLNPEGDAARSMRSFIFSPGIEGFDEKLVSFREFERRKHRGLAENETWAILYAQLDRRCSLDNGEEMIPSWYVAYKIRMKQCSGEFEDVRDALVPLSYLRLSVPMRVRHLPIEKLV